MEPLTVTGDLILVDERDEPVGFAAKLDAHRGEGLLHRAFSIVLYDRAGQMLIQRRARTKYHFAGLWANACCGHPARGEDTIGAASRRLREELGLRAELRFSHTFVYTARDETSGLVEREFDHVFLGRTGDVPLPDPAEIESWRWVETVALGREMASAPAAFAPWFGLIVARLHPEIVPSSHGQD